MTPREELERYVSMLKQLEVPALVERFVLRNGEEFNPPSYPSPQRMGFKPQMCFKNAYMVASSDPEEYTYVEGFALTKELYGKMPITTIHHAWCVDRWDKIIDPTWNSRGAAYFGVRFSLDRVYKELSKNKVFGLLITTEMINIRMLFEVDPDLQKVVLEETGQDLSRYVR